jgi:hypothetical protein
MSQEVLQETSRPRTITVELPDMPETRRFQSSPQLGPLKSFLYWLGEYYALSEYDGTGYSTRVDLESEAEVLGVIQKYFDIDADELAREEEELQNCIRRAVTTALQ